MKKWQKNIFPKAKTEKDFWNTSVKTEKEKLLYFILTCPQKVVLVKTGEKEAEKQFLGYEFSERDWLVPRLQPYYLNDAI